MTESGSEVVAYGVDGSRGLEQGPGHQPQYRREGHPAQDAADLAAQAGAVARPGLLPVAVVEQPPPPEAAAGFSGPSAIGMAHRAQKWRSGRLAVQHQGHATPPWLSGSAGVRTSGRAGAGRPGKTGGTDGGRSGTPCGSATGTRRSLAPVPLLVRDSVPGGGAVSGGFRGGVVGPGPRPGRGSGGVSASSPRSAARCRASAR